MSIDATARAVASWPQEICVGRNQLTHCWVYALFAATGSWFRRYGFHDVAPAADELSSSISIRSLRNHGAPYPTISMQVPITGVRPARR